MRKTVLVTGASSGFGKAIALKFLAEGWNVAAGLRRPDPALYPDSAQLRQFRLDVTDADAVPRVVKEVLGAFGRIDALVNNAGIGVMSALEHTPDAVAREVFETNLFGTLRMAKAVIPTLRAQGSGTILNMTSTMAIAPMPFMSIYSATKWAIEGLSEAMAYELHPFGLRVRLLEPGLAPTTNFGSNAGSRAEGLTPEPYAAIAGAYFSQMQQSYPAAFTTEQEVTEVTYAAATDTGDRLRYRIGADAEWLYEQRRQMDDSAFLAQMRAMFMPADGAM